VQTYMFFLNYTSLVKNRFIIFGHRLIFYFSDATKAFILFVFLIEAKKRKNLKFSLLDAATIFLFLMLVMHKLIV